MASQQQPTGRWRHAAFLIITATAGPSALSQAFAFAVLGWYGGVLVNAAMAAGSFLCMYHQAHLFHVLGERQDTYKAMATAILGRGGGRAVAGVQYFINVGVAITNTIMSGQLLQDIASRLTDPARGGSAAPPGAMVSTAPVKVLAPDSSDKEQAEALPEEAGK